MIATNSRKMNVKIKEFGPLRKKWERFFAINQGGLKSIRQTAERAGLHHRVLARAIEDGVGSESIRQALSDMGIPAELIPLPTCNRTLAGIIYQQQELLNRCQKI